MKKNPFCIPKNGILSLRHLDYDRKLMLKNCPLLHFVAGAGGGGTYEATLHNRANLRLSFRYTLTLNREPISSFTVVASYTEVLRDGAGMTCLIDTSAVPLASMLDTTCDTPSAGQTSATYGKKKNTRAAG